MEPDMKYKSLSDRISETLHANGITVSERISDGHALLEALGQGNHKAYILPVDPMSTCSEEATRESELLAKFLDRAPVNRPITIVRDRWERQREQTVGRLLAHCGIFTQVFARNCEVRRIEKPAAQAFMEEFHSYGPATCRYCYGLFVKRTTGEKASVSQEFRDEAGISGNGPTDMNRVTAGSEAVLSKAETEAGNGIPRLPAGTLVAVAEFSNARKWIKGGRTIRSYEWIRYASLPYTRIAGGMGKILKAFIEDVHPDDIMSYADLEWSDGSVYRQLGFREDGAKPPVLFSIDRNTWERAPLKEYTANAPVPGPQPEAGTRPGQDPDMVLYRNCGSVKYRLKLTDYQDTPK